MTPDFLDRLFGSSEGEPAGDPGGAPVGNHSDQHLELIAGLGNPGKKYDHTRHNIGFMILDRVAEIDALSWSSERKWEADIARSDTALFLKPKTYMNDSGRAVGRAAQFHKTEADRILIVCDDITLPLGAVRIRRKGSSGGHNGLKSIAAHLSTEQFPRLRVGVGSGEAGPAGREGGVVSHVLGRFSENEASSLEEAIDKAIEAIRVSLEQGLDAAMSRFNQKGQGQPSSES